VENEFPFAAALTKRIDVLVTYRDAICSAVLISVKDILTSAHCLGYEVVDGVQIITGSIDILSGSIYYPAWWTSFYPWSLARNVNYGFFSNDIAIMRVNHSLQSVHLMLYLRSQ
jgi:secreted trypsin-like serine protease